MSLSLGSPVEGDTGAQPDDSFSAGTAEKDMRFGTSFIPIFDILRHLTNEADLGSTT
jgi:hypothetical protein